MGYSSTCHLLAILTFLSIFYFIQYYYNNNTYNNDDDIIDNKRWYHVWIVCLSLPVMSLVFVCLNWISFKQFKHH